MEGGGVGGGGKNACAEGLLKFDLRKMLMQLSMGRRKVGEVKWKNRKKIKIKIKLK